MRYLTDGTSYYIYGAYSIIDEGTFEHKQALKILVYAEFLYFLKSLLDINEVYFIDGYLVPKIPNSFDTNIFSFAYSTENPKIEITTFFLDNAYNIEIPLLAYAAYDYYYPNEITDFTYFYRYANLTMNINISNFYSEIFNKVNTYEEYSSYNSEYYIQ